MEKSQKKWIRRARGRKGVKKWVQMEMHARIIDNEENKEKKEEKTMTIHFKEENTFAYLLWDSTVHRCNRILQGSHHNQWTEEKLISMKWGRDHPTFEALRSLSPSKKKHWASEAELRLYRRELAPFVGQWPMMERDWNVSVSSYVLSQNHRLKWTWEIKRNTNCSFTWSPCGWQTGPSLVAEGDRLPLQRQIEKTQREPVEKRCCEGVNFWETDEPGETASHWASYVQPDSSGFIPVIITY